jgi:hypothetical protein
MSNTLAGEGTILQVKISTTFTNIGRVEEIDGNETDVTAVKKTHLLSAIQEYRPGKIPDVGTITFKLQLDPADAGHAQLRARAETPGVIDDFKLKYNDGNTTPGSEAFSGFVKKFKKTGFSDGNNVMAELEVQLTTLPVFTAGTP